jgi:hypothetical protein
MSSCLIGLLMFGLLSLSAELALLNYTLLAQENGDFKTNDGKSLGSNFSANTSGISPNGLGDRFTISCSDFKKLFDALTALNIGNEVTKGSINQSMLDGVENIFNIYAGNCSQLDEYEFD